MKSGAQPGNKNAAGKREWSDAIRKEIVSRKRWADLAKALVDKAEEGDMSAMKEMGDRLEGKPAQTIQGPGENGDFNINITAEDSSVL